MGLVSGGIGMRGIGGSIGVGPFRLGTGMSYRSMGSLLMAFITLTIVVCIVLPFRLLTWGGGNVALWNSQGRPALSTMPRGDKTIFLVSAASAVLAAGWLLYVAIAVLVSLITG